MKIGRRGFIGSVAAAVILPLRAPAGVPQLTKFEVASGKDFKPLTGWPRTYLEVSGRDHHKRWLIEGPKVIGIEHDDAFGGLQLKTENFVFRGQGEPFYAHGLHVSDHSGKRLFSIGFENGPFYFGADGDYLTFSPRVHLSDETDVKLMLGPHNYIEEYLLELADKGKR